jgi:hypothetical protein
MRVSRMAVSQWAKHLQPHQGDIIRLQNRPIPGRPPGLTTTPWQQVLAWRAQGARRAGFEPDRGTLRRIRALILVACGVDDHPGL